MRHNPFFTMGPAEQAAAVAAFTAAHPSLSPAEYTAFMMPPARRAALARQVGHSVTSVATTRPSLEATPPVHDAGAGTITTFAPPRITGAHVVRPELT